MRLHGLFDAGTSAMFRGLAERFQQTFITHLTGSLEYHLGTENGETAIAGNLMDTPMN